MKPFSGARGGITAGLIAFCGLWLMNNGQYIAAQPTSEPLQGTVSEVKQRGKTLQLTVLDSQERSLEVTPTARTEFAIVGSGDTGFLVPGQFLEAQGVLTNGRIFINAVTIHYVKPGTRSTKPGGIVKAPPKPGQSQNLHLVAGVIETAAPDADYPDYTLVTLKGVRGPALMLEKKVRVSLSTTDPAFISENAPVTLEGNEIRGGKFQASRIIIEQKAGFDSKRLLAGEQ